MSNLDFTIEELNNNFEVRNNSIFIKGTNIQIDSSVKEIIVDEQGRRIETEYGTYESKVKSINSIEELNDFLNSRVNAFEDLNFIQNGNKIRLYEPVKYSTGNLFDNLTTGNISESFTIERRENFREFIDKLSSIKEPVIYRAKDFALDDVKTGAAASIKDITDAPLRENFKDKRASLKQIINNLEINLDEYINKISDSPEALKNISKKDFELLKDFLDNYDDTNPTIRNKFITQINYAASKFTDSASHGYMTDAWLRKMGGYLIEDNLQDYLIKTKALPKGYTIEIGNESKRQETVKESDGRIYKEVKGSGAPGGDFIIKDSKGNVQGNIYADSKISFDTEGRNSYRHSKTISEVKKGNKVVVIFNSVDGIRYISGNAYYGLYEEWKKEVAARKELYPNSYQTDIERSVDNDWSRLLNESSDKEVQSIMASLENTIDSEGNIKVNENGIEVKSKVRTYFESSRANLPTTTRVSGDNKGVTVISSEAKRKSKGVAPDGEGCLRFGDLDITSSSPAVFGRILGGK